MIKNTIFINNYSPLGIYKEPISIQMVNASWNIKLYLILEKIACYISGSRKFLRRGEGRGCPAIVINMFLRGPSKPPSRNNWIPLGPSERGPIALRGVQTSIPKVTYS